MMEDEWEADDDDDDAETLLTSYIVYVGSLCGAMFLYCVTYAFYLWTLGPPPPPPPPRPY